MPTPPQTISLTPASAPGAPSAITLTAASGPGAPSTIALSAASQPLAPEELTIAGTKGLAVGGTLSPDATGFLYQAGIASDGRPYYSNNGSPTPPASGTYRIVAYFLGKWNLGEYVDNILSGSWAANAGTEATPDLATGWAPVAGGPSESGTPTFTLSTAAPSAPSTITLTAASQPAAPGVITPS